MLPMVLRGSLSDARSRLHTGTGDSGTALATSVNHTLGYIEVIGLHKPFNRRRQPIRAKHT